MDNYQSEYETEEKKKFQITRGMVILASIIFVIIIIIIIVIVNSINSKKPEYTTEDFNKLESRMEDESMAYLSQNNIELTSEEIKIELKNLLIENGGSIDSNKTKAAKVCDGYVLASKRETESYKAYIKCGNLYTSEGYVESDKQTTTKKTTAKKDTEKPVITIIGEKEITINLGSNYSDAGAKATDNIDGDITSKIKVENNVDVSDSGIYTVVYTVTDKAGNRAEATRKVTVIPVTTTTTTKAPTTTKTTTKANTGSSSVKTTTKTIITTAKVTTPPTITLYGKTSITMNVGEQYKDPGYSARDAKGNDLTSKVNVSGSVNTNAAGTYTIKYTVTDVYGNTSSKIRTVKVNSTYISVQDITLTPNSFTLSVGQTKKIEVYISPANATNKSITWSSSNPSVATVSNGTVQAKAKGTAIITVNGADGKSKTSTVIVK